MTLPPRTAARSASWLALLGALTALGPISIDLYLPAFGLIEQEFGRGVEHTLAAYLFGVAIGQLIYGPVSDHFGRKPPLYVALLLYIAGSIACAAAGSMTLLILSRLVQALGGCAGMVIARAIVRDSCEPHDAARVFSTLIVIVAVAPILAPSLGGYVVALGNWRVLFYVQAAFGLCLLIAVHLRLQETRTQQRASQLKVSHALRSYVALLKDRDFVCYSLISAFSMAVIFSYISSAPTVLITQYGVSPQRLALLMGVGGMSFVVASQLNVRRLRTHSPAQIINVAIWLSLLLATALVAVNFHHIISLPTLVAFQVTIFMAGAHIGPNVSAQALASQGQRAGVASALLGSIQSMGSTLAGAASGMFTSSVRVVGLLMLAAAVGMMIAHRVLIFTNKK